MKLRRAIIAQQQQEYAKAQQHALDSQTDFGLLLAAEVYLIDGEKEESLKLLKKISSRQEERAARQYIRLLEDENLWVGSLAEAQASWALKDYVLGVRSVQGVFEKIPVTFANYAEEVLIWAGRAAAVGETAIAKSLLLLDLSGLPEEQVWRIEATNAIISCGEGKTDECSHSDEFIF